MRQTTFSCFSVLMLLLWEASARVCFGQATVSFNNGAAVNGPLAPVYDSEPCGEGVHKTGNTSAGIPAGTQIYHGVPLSGGTYFAQLLGAPGSNQPPELLYPASTPVTTFRIGGSTAGRVATITATFTNIPADAPVATVQMVVWDNGSGYYSNWDLARIGYQNMVEKAGFSLPFNVYALGGGTNAPASLTGLRSFNIGRHPIDFENDFSFDQQPRNTVNAAGGTAEFSVLVYTNGPFEYQWLHDGTVINGATQTSLKITNVQPSDAGTYSIVATNYCQGALPSSNASLVVFTPAFDQLAGLRLRFYGNTGQAYSIVGSTSLTASNWTLLGSVTNTNGTATYVDTDSLSLTSRFYRASFY